MSAKLAIIWYRLSRANGDLSCFMLLLMKRATNPSGMKMELRGML